MARPDKKPVPGANDGIGLSFAPRVAKPAEAEIRLSDLPIGARLLVRSKKDWRTAAISRIMAETEMVVLTVCSPTGHSYRIRRELATAIVLEGGFAILPAEETDNWRSNFSRYDSRW